MPFAAGTVMAFLFAVALRFTVQKFLEGVKVYIDGAV